MKLRTEIAVVSFIVVASSCGIVLGQIPIEPQNGIVEGKPSAPKQQPKAPLPSRTAEEWSKSHTVKQGDIKVTVQTHPKMQVFYRDVLGKLQAGSFFTIDLLVTNVSTNKKVDFESWRNRATLSDDSHNIYKRIPITPEKQPGSAYPDNASIYPQKELRDRVVFETPVENIKWLHLELPAENFGGIGMLRFEIPASKTATASAGRELSLNEKLKKYDLNKDGKLDKTERDKMNADEKAKR